MKTILLSISYRGTNYKGFQKQKNTTQTIQEYLENALEKIYCKKISVTASGRTDAGVHAIMQCVSFTPTKDILIEFLPRAINTYLPQDIMVTKAVEKEEDFNARFCAKRKTYRYVYCKKDAITPFNYDLASVLNYSLDENLIKSCIQKIKGTHNFKAFSTSCTNITNFERTIFDFSYKFDGDYLIFEITGNGFLYNMVRIIIGTITDIARGKLPLETIDKMFESGDRNFGGKTAPAKGLYLLNVEYI